MEIFGLIFLVVLCVLVGVGIAFGCFALLCLALLLVFGIISSATGVALYQRSVSAGYRTFVYLTFAALGLPAGLLVAFLVSAMWEMQGLIPTILAGSLGGILSGLAVAYFVCGVSRRLLVPRTG